MKTKIFSFFVAAMTVTALVSSGSIQQSASQLYQSGIYKEDVEGKLEEAIAIYQEVIKKFPLEGPVAAKALFHMGLCYEKLGNQEAQKAYQRLIQDYPGQKHEVALARERLSQLSGGLGKASSQPTFRKIRMPFELSEWSGGQLSPDGTTFAFGSENRIWVVPVQGKVQPNLAGEPIAIPGTEDAWAYGMSWSRDGKWIAFNGGNNPFIYVVPSSGGTLRKIPVQRNRMGGVATGYPVSLSPSGVTVAFSARRDGIPADQALWSAQIYVASVEGGDIRQLTKDGGTNPSYSPDGSKIAYAANVTVQEKNVPKSDVWVMPAIGGDAIRVTSLPGGATSPIWSPDGKMIAFLRTEEMTSYKKEICIVPVSGEGRPLASPTQIKFPFETDGTFDVLPGWTSDNRIGILAIKPETAAVYTVPAGGGMALQITGSGAMDPQWSPDGKQVYFRWQDGQLGFVPSGGGKLGLHEGIGGGRDSDFFMPHPGAGNSVSPDGKTVVFSGVRRILLDGKTRFEVNIYTISVDGGKPTKITNIEPPNQARFPRWSPDGRWIGFLGPEPGVIFRVSAKGGEQSRIAAEGDAIRGAYFDWSPDGRWVAYFSKAGSLSVMPSDGGKPRVVCKIPVAEEDPDLSWSSDGRTIAFVAGGKIWVVPSEGGEPVVVKTDVDARAIRLDWSPDGRKLAFTGVSGGNKELWFMESFLPLVKEGK